MRSLHIPSIHKPPSLLDLSSSRTGPGLGRPLLNAGGIDQHERLSCHLPIFQMTKLRLGVVASQSCLGGSGTSTVVFRVCGNVDFESRTLGSYFGLVP